MQGGSQRHSCCWPRVAEATQVVDSALGWFENVISMGGRLQGKARSDRRLMFALSAVMAVVTSIMAGVITKWPLMWFSAVALTLPQCVMAVLCLCRIDLTPNIMQVYIGAVAFGIIGTDYNVRTVGSPPMWPAFVLLADMSLVLNLGRGFATGLIAFTALWVVITGVEGVARFGLYDLPGSAPDWHRWERLQETLHLHTPAVPCQPDEGCA